MVTECVVELKTYSYAGLSLGAIHWYGELTPDWTLNSVDVTHRVTKSFAKHYNKHLRKNYSKEYVKANKMEPGWEYYGFITEEDVIARAIKIWKDIFPEGCKLIHENTGRILDQC
jgi:hypothetical protein